MEYQTGTYVFANYNSGVNLINFTSLADHWKMGILSILMSPYTLMAFTVIAQRPFLLATLCVSTKLGVPID